MQDNNNVGIVFISGVGLIPAVWDKVRAIVPVPSIAVAFPNRGSKTANDSLTFDDYVSSAKRQIDSAPFKEYILVCHSIGGAVGLRLAKILGGAIKGFVGVSASIPLNGQSYVSSLPFPQNIITALMIRTLGTRLPKGIIESGLCSDLIPEDTKNVVDNFTPESKSLYFSKIEHSGIAIPSMYIRTLQDKAFTISAQNQMASNLGTIDVKTLESGHLPMLSKPGELAELIVQFSKTV